VHLFDLSYAAVWSGCHRGGARDGDGTGLGVKA
jgi:hypothetical protein